MKYLSQGIAITLVVGAAFLVGRRSIDAGISKMAAADLVRAGGDSAVTAYLSSSAMETFVEEALADTVTHYQAEVRAAARVVIERVPVRVTDTLIMPPDTVAIPPGDQMREIAFPPMDTNNIRVELSLWLSPPPIFMRREMLVSFDPDTLILALLRTPGGLDRFAAAATREGMAVRIGDAAQVRQSDPKVLRGATTLLLALGCGLTGYFIAAEETTGVLISGGACAVGLGLKLGIPHL